MSKYFSYEESPYKIGYYIIKLAHSNLRITGTIGSCNVIMARICNLSYAQFLRMCRDKYNATIIGKGSIYGMPYFSSEHLSDLKALIKVLNERTDLILKTID